MFQSVEIENFQSHVDSYLEFSPGINLITGETDKGKSAILRCLYLVARNRPAGSQFVNWSNKKNVANIVLINDDHTIGRSVGKNKNCYFLDDLDEELTGLGKHGVPDAVQKALRLNDLNFQRQQDSFFLFDKSAPEVGRYLNDVIDLEVIDQSLTHAKKRVNQFETERTYLEAVIAEQEKELEQYDFVDVALKKVQYLEKQEKILNENQSKLKQLETLSVKLELLEKDRLKLNSKLKVLKEVNSVSIHYKMFEKNKKKLGDLLRAVEALEALEEEKDKYEHVLGFENEIKKVKDVYDVYQKSVQERNKLQKLVDEIKVMEEDRQHAQETLVQLQQTYDRVMPEKCPICGTIKK